MPCLLIEEVKTSSSHRPVALQKPCPTHLLWLLETFLVSRSSSLARAPHRFSTASQTVDGRASSLLHHVRCASCGATHLQKASDSPQAPGWPPTWNHPRHPPRRAPLETFTTTAQRVRRMHLNGQAGIRIAHAARANAGPGNLRAGASPSTHRSKEEQRVTSPVSLNQAIRRRPLVSFPPQCSWLAPGAPARGALARLRKVVGLDLTSRPAISICRQQRHCFWAGTGLGKLAQEEPARLGADHGPDGSDQRRRTLANMSQCGGHWLVLLGTHDATAIHQRPRRTTRC